MQASVVFAAPSASTSLQAKASGGTVIFNGVAVGMKLQGKGEGPEGTIEVGKNIQGVLKFKMETLDTGIGLRNQHMKEKYLEVAKHPYSELKVEEVQGFDLAKPDGKYPFKGQITVHSVAKPVMGNVEVKKDGNIYKVKATFDTKISYFNMPIPAYAGVTVKDDVSVVVETQLQ